MNCISLTKATIYSSNVTNCLYCFNNTSISKSVYIPFTYSNGVNTKTFNSFVTAGYLYANGESTNINGVTVIDLNSGNTNPTVPDDDEPTMPGGTPIYDDDDDDIPPM